MTNEITYTPYSTVRWDFKITKEGFTTRYGHSNLAYYKQVVFPASHTEIENPVKRISKEMYKLAQKLSEQSASYGSA